MMLAREFVRNQNARITDFSTNEADTPLIVQFGANNEVDLARAAKMIMPYTDGIGLNCGCPIKEQVREGIGAALMTDPERVASMVRAVKATCGPEFCVEVKIRIHSDLQETVRFARLVEDAGADYITVHGRRKTQRSSEPANWEAIKLIKESVKCPVVANGDAFTMDDVNKIVELTGVDGVMSARGILANPALFSGYNKTPWGAIELFWDYVTSYGLPFRLTQHHFSEMVELEFTRKQKRSLNESNNLPELLDWFDARFDLKRRGEPGFGERVEFPWKSTYHERELDNELNENASLNLASDLASVHLAS
ncbi:Dus4p [Sugiyamaella lignohabitans]|uniref:tRNA-dihydrouridine synthase n=1 Tax=Sugiyamaella lignohabitans TaxID=796027 RepID=A0A161HM33_9ASCO|nr:Dus4p [Sugiyamaella lignohabitans]ANB14617.1 Dus4p [Sugiyamaella lignohabitans]